MQSVDVPRSGVVCGLTLREVRGSLGITQSRLAEVAEVDLNTVKGWETGRRPLTRVRAADVTRLRFRLHTLGARPDHLACFDAAQHVDFLLTGILAADDRRHPLAHEVITKTTTELLTWPLTGIAPRVFRADAGKSPRPVFGAGQRARVYGALRSAAEGADHLGDQAPLLRRQAGYLLASDPDSTDYLRALAAAEARRISRLDRWSPHWSATRSLAIARALAGDPEPLHQFVTTGCASDDTLAANLNYYAYWVGETAGVESSDAFMAGELGPWRGDKLLAALTGNLTRELPHLELCVRAVWALLARRPRLIDDPGTAEALGARVGVLLDDGSRLPGSARLELEQVHYLVETRSRV